MHLILYCTLVGVVLRIVQLERAKSREPFFGDHRHTPKSSSNAGGLHETSLFHQGVLLMFVVEKHRTESIRHLANKSARVLSFHVHEICIVIFSFSRARTLKRGIAFAIQIFRMYQTNFPLTFSPLSRSWRRRETQQRI